MEHRRDFGIGSRFDSLCCGYLDTVESGTRAKMCAERAKILEKFEISGAILRANHRGTAYGLTKI